MIDWTKPIRTKDGAEARLLGELSNTSYPMVVAVTATNAAGDTYEALHRYRRDGRFAEAAHRSDHQMRLENVPVVYVILLDGVGYGDISEATDIRDQYWPNNPIAEIALEDGKPVSVRILDE